MKHPIIMPILALTLIVSLVSCNPSSTPPDGSSQSSREETAAPSDSGIDSQDMNALFDDYFDLALSSGIASASWTHPSEISPHFLLNLYTYHWLEHNTWDFTAQELRMPATDVEAFLTARFDWSTRPLDMDALRNLGEYDPSDDTFVCTGLGAALEAAVTGATQNGDALALTYETYDRADGATILWSGTFTLRLDGNRFVYLSNERID